MTGPGIYSYSTTPANNVQANTGINWDEGMSPAAVNNSARQNMTDTRNLANDIPWFKYGKGDLDYSPVYASATTFTVAGGDYRTPYHVGRRVRAVGSSTGTIYGSIGAVAYSTDTTVTVIWDSGSLSNEALVISLGPPVTGKPIPVGSLSDTPVLQNFLTGLTLSAAGSTATFGIAAGQAADSTNAAILTLASALTKTTSSWAVGTGNGGMDTGSVANSTWYHVWLIKRVDTGVVDVLFSLSASSPTMPTSYTLKRRIGSMKTDGSAQWYKFSQLGDEFLWAVPFADISTTTLDTTATLFTLNTPLGVQTIAKLRGRMAHLTVGNILLINSPDETSAAADGVTGNVTAVAQVTNQAEAFVQDVRTNTSSQVRLVGTASSTTVRGVTCGWIDARGKN